MQKISLKEVSFKYPTASTNVFESINLDINANANGKVITIVGPSGCGKTTLIKLLDRELTPSSGTIKFENFDNVIFLPQNPILFDHLSVYENAFLFKNINSKKQFFKEELLRKTADKLKFPEKYFNENTSIQQLSGGEKQKLALIRSFSIEPNVIIMDEPCNSIDTVNKTEFLLELKRIVYEFKTLVLYVSHDINEVKLIADEVVFFDSYCPTEIYNGKKLIHANINQILERPNTIDAMKFFNIEYVNDIKCVWSNDYLHINGKKTKIENVGDNNVIPNGDYTLYFGPKQIQFTLLKKDSMFEVKNIFSTEYSQYSILIETQFQKEVMFQRNNSSNDRYDFFSITGQVFLLRHENQKMYKKTI